MDNFFWILVTLLCYGISLGFSKTTVKSPTTLRSITYPGGRKYGRTTRTSTSNTRKRFTTSGSTTKVTSTESMYPDVEGSGMVSYGNREGLCRYSSLSGFQECEDDKCRKDSDCGGRRKCCPVQCSYDCKDPLNVIINLMSTSARDEFDSIVYIVGSRAEYRCNITTVNPQASIRVEWNYAGYDVIPTENSRIQITKTQEVVTKYTSYISSITFNEILESDDYELLECWAEVDNKREGNELSVQVVTAKFEEPLVHVEAGRDYSITCFVNGPYAVVWCKDGQVIDFSSDVRGSGFRYLELYNLTTTAVYGCGVMVNGTEQRDIKCTTFQTVNVYSLDDQPCPAQMRNGISWTKTYPDNADRKWCPSGYDGFSTRKCRRNGTAGVWEEADYSSCVNSKLSELSKKVSLIDSGVSDRNLNTIIKEVANETAIINNNQNWTTGDLATSIGTISTIARIVEDRNYNVMGNDLQYFVYSVNNIIDPNVIDAWKMLADEKDNTSATTVLQAVTSFGHNTVRGLPAGSHKRVTSNNIVVEAGRSNTLGDINFYGQAIGSHNERNIRDFVTLEKETIINSYLVENGSVDYLGVYYNTFSKLLPTNVEFKRDITNVTDIVNDGILSFSLTRGPKMNLDPPVQLHFLQQQISSFRPSCVFWDFEKTAWSSEGCRLISTKDNITICHCDHLTNFAILISPHRSGGVHHKVLAVISIIGCSISLVGVLATIICYLVVWKHVKSEKSWLLMNLCVTLSVALVVFLAGVEQTQNRVLCNVIAGFLHYLFLCVFFLMLAEGISIAVSVVNVFARRSKLKYLLPMAYGVPAIIVVITFGVSGAPASDKFCWLSIGNRFLLLAFVIPAVCVILANIVITVVVLRALFSTRTMMNKSEKEKAKTGIRSVAVLAPIFGLTWIFGVLSVNESTIVFQYLFVIFTSLQGLSIFIFHCLLNKAVMATIRQRWIKKRWEGTSTSDTPISRRNFHPISDSSLKNSGNHLTLERSNDARATTTTFANPKSTNRNLKSDVEKKTSNIQPKEQVEKEDNKLKEKEQECNDVIESTKL